MKIKSTKKLNLPELIQYVIDKGWNSYQVTSDNGVDVYFSYSNNFVICDNSSISLDDTFTVEVCEELTEKTELDGLVAITNHDKIRLIDNIHTIESALSFEKTYERYENIYGKSDGELKLIWSRDSGIPEDGILELM